MKNKEELIVIEEHIKKLQDEIWKNELIILALNGQKTIMELKGETENEK